MRKVSLILVTLLLLAGLAAAQSAYPQQPTAPPTTQTQQPGQPPPASAQQPGGIAAAPPVKTGPRAKTQAEYDAYKAAVENSDLGAAETAAADFVAKFPDSELFGPLYESLQRRYQDQNNAEKTVEMGARRWRKTLTTSSSW